MIPRLVPEISPLDAFCDVVVVVVVVVAGVVGIGGSRSWICAISMDADRYAVQDSSSSCKTKNSLAVFSTF